jgi:hydrogenase maturation protease
VGLGIVQADQLDVADRTIVLGIGNPIMGDDGMGIHVVQDLLTRSAILVLPEGNIEILDGGTLGYLLLDHVNALDALIVVDAANIGAEPGELRVFQNRDMDDFLSNNQTSSVHEVGLLDLMQMMALMGQTPRQRALVGVQPAVIDWGTELSPAVAPSVAKAAQTVIDVLTAWYGK